MRDGASVSGKDGTGSRRWRSGRVGGTERLVAAERNRLRALLRKLEEQAGALAAANLQAERARAAAESANRAKDEFVAMLGHEIRNPLAPIRTSLELMRLRGGRSPEQLVIERQVEHLVRLVDDLLDVSRMTRGKLELKKEPLEVGRAVVEGVEIAGPLLEARHQQLEVAVPPEGLPIVGDPDRLAQVVSNLVTNASKYSAPGTTIRIAAGQVEGVARLRVRDQGIGIATEMLERIFEPFVQARQSQDRSTGGLGLGLAIVRSLVELHGGRVFATSEGAGRGSELVVDLPLAATAVVGRGVRTPATDGCGQASALAAACKERILVVDDNSDAAESLAEALVHLGYEVTTVRDGPSALSAVKGFRPDVCLVDLGLPVMDGYELAQQLRQSSDLPEGARIIAITGYAQKSDRHRTTEAGFSAHLVKPITLDELTRTLVN